MGRSSENRIKFRKPTLTAIERRINNGEFTKESYLWEKGQIEKNARDARHRIWQSAGGFKTLVDLNLWLKQRCVELWQELPHPKDKRRTIGDYLQAERACLMEAPAAFDDFVEFNKRVA